MTDMMMDYIEAKYGTGGPDSDRFENHDHEVHTSQIADCQRKLFLDRREDVEAGASVYFELGRVFEVIYGAALAWQHGDLSREDVAFNKPWELPGLVDRVQQDVNIHIEFADGATVPGESDWVVYEEGAEPLDEVRLDYETGERVAVRDGEESEYGGEVQEVIETKTKNDVSQLDGPKTKHFYQLYGYMVALDAPGHVAYVERDDLSLREYHVERQDKYDMDLEYRVRQHVRNLRGDEEPDTNPASKWMCYYCEHRDGCGGSLW